MTPEQSVRDDYCRTERLAFLLRQDLTGIACTDPWGSVDERNRYRGAVLNTYRRLRDPSGGTSTEHAYSVDKQVADALHGVAVMARGRASAVQLRPEPWAGHAALQLGQLADDVDYLGRTQLK